MNITGNTILITGGTSGIGRALAEALHAKGNKVIVAGRRQNLLDEVTKANPGMEGLQFDAADEKSIKAFAEQVRTKYPKLNVLFNNAGISKIEDWSADSIDTSVALSILQTNINGVLLLTAELLPLLKKQPKSTLMATSSGLAFVPLPVAPTYSATKAFLHSWLESLRVQLKNTSVEVLELVPPYVQTELGGEQQKSDPRAMPLDEFVKEVVQILEDNKEQKGEILVERVNMLRWAEKEGKYDQVLKMFESF